jgi:hypothetical protein
MVLPSKRANFLPNASRQRVIFRYNTRILKMRYVHRFKTCICIFSNWGFSLLEGISSGFISISNRYFIQRNLVGHPISQKCFPKGFSLHKIEGFTAGSRQEK